MIGYILITILAIVGWVTLILGIKKDIEWVYTIGIILCIGGSCLFGVSTIYLATRQSEAVSFKNERVYRQELVYSISDNMSPQTVNKIIASATDYNERIERNKKHCDSKMWGCLYNKGIAEAEPIVIPKFKYQIVKEE